MFARLVTRRSRRVARQRRRTALAIVVGAFVVLAATVGWLAFRGLQAKTDLEAAVTSSTQLTAAVGAGDLDAATAAVDELARHSASAAAAASDPVWRAAELVPGLGPNLAAVRIAAAQANVLAVDVAKPLVTLSSSMMSGASGSLLDVDALAAGTGSLTRAGAALTASTAELATVDRAALLPPVADGISQLSEVVEQAVPAVSALIDASTIVPSMLGADGPRTILVMLQNTAELRTGGGITGTFIEIRADKGALSITRQADSADFRKRTSDIIPVPASTTALYGPDVARFVQDTSITPDFALTAQLASAWWQERTGTAADAVISVDPIVLKALLGAVGPVKTAAGTITQDNMVQELLVAPYLELSQDAQTSAFEDVATAVFTTLTHGDADPVKLAGALGAAVDEGRVSVWSAHEPEQSVLARTELAGPAARQAAAGRQAYAVYLNDVTGGKMGTFLDVSITTGVGVCRADGKRTVEVAVTLTNTAPADAGTRFPANMTGGGHYGIAAGRIGTTVAVSGATGAFFGGAVLDGTRVGVTDATDAGFPVSAYTVDLAPGATSTIAFRFDTPATEDITPTILHTPLIEGPDISTTVVACG